MREGYRPKPLPEGAKAKRPPWSEAKDGYFTFDTITSVQANRIITLLERIEERLVDMTRGQA